MEFLLKNPYYLNIFGLLLTIAGIYNLHIAVKIDATNKIKFQAKEPHDAAIVDFYQAKLGLRYIIYGFLIQMLTIIL